MMAGNVGIALENDGVTQLGRARINAMGFLTGSMDTHPLVAGVIDGFIGLLRTDPDFAKFRREVLEGRSPKVNTVLNDMEESARRNLMVIPVEPGQDPASVLEDLLKGTRH